MPLSDIFLHPEGARHSPGERFATGSVDAIKQARIQATSEITRVGWGGSSR